MAAASSQTSGYAFTPPNRAKIASALEGLKPFSRVMSPAEFTRDVASAYDVADDQRNAPSMALAKANLALADAGLRAANISIEGANSLGQGIIQAGSAIGQGLIQGYTGKEEQRMALEAEERKHSRALEIEAIKSARSSEALQKRVEYLREAAANRLAEVGANKKPPRKLIGGTATVSSPRGGGVEDEEDLEGETPIDPNLNAPLVDLPLPDLLPASVEVPETEQTQYDETLPPDPVQRPLFELTPPPVMPSGSDVIPPDLSMRGIIPEEAARFASAEAGGAPQPLPSSAIGLPLTDLAGAIDIAYIPSETARQMQELQQEARNLVPSTEAPLAQMPAASAGQATGQAPLKGLHPDFQSGSFANQAEAFAMQQLPVPEGYNKPQVKKEFDDVAGVDYWEVSMPEPMTQAEKSAIAKSEQTEAPPDEEKLRKEFLAESKTFEIVRDAWDNIKTSSKPDPITKNFSPASDMAMVFSFMKLLDPTSVVRETEYANAARAAGVPERVVASIDQVMRGTILGPDQRQDFLNTAKRLYARRVQSQQRNAGFYRKIAEAKGMNPDFVAPDLRSADRKYDLEQKVKEKAVQVQKAQAGTEEYDKAFEELKQLMREQTQAELEEERAISIE